MDKLLMLPSIYLLYHLSIILDSGQAYNSFVPVPIMPKAPNPTASRAPHPGGRDDR